MTNTLKKILIATTVVAFTACGGGSSDTSNPISNPSAGADGGASSSGTRLKSSKIVTDNFENYVEYTYDGNKVISSKGTTKINSELNETETTTWEYKNNQVVKLIFKQYEPNKTLKMTTTKVITYDGKKRPYKDVTKSVQGTKTEIYTETSIEKTKWEGRYPTEEKMNMFMSGVKWVDRIWTVKIDNDRVESLNTQDILHTYTYDDQDRKDPLFYLLQGDTEKYGESELTHHRYLITNTELKNIADNKIKNEKKQYEFNTLGLVIKETLKNGMMLIYEYEEF